MKKLTLYLLAVVAGNLLPLFDNTVVGQQEIEPPKRDCSELMDSGYVSDGKEHIAQLNKNNRARFQTTFYGGSQYRVGVCSDIDNYPVAFKVLDSEQHILFDNTKHAYSPVWNFYFSSTVVCVVVVEVDTEKQINEPVKLLIGFKQKLTDFYQL